MFQTRGFPNILYIRFVKSHAPFSNTFPSLLSKFKPGYSNAHCFHTNSREFYFSKIDYTFNQNPRNGSSARTSRFNKFSLSLFALAALTFSFKDELESSISSFLHSFENAFQLSSIFDCFEVLSCQDISLSNNASLLQNPPYLTPDSQQGTSQHEISKDSDQENQDSLATTSKNPKSLISSITSALFSSFSSTKFLILKFRNSVSYFLYFYIREPLVTFVRFGKLLGYFTPIIITFPIIFFGSRIPSKNNELSGAIWWYKLICAQMSYAGPTFVKLSQWASTRTDIFPPQFCEELSLLQSKNTPHSYKFSKFTIESNLNGYEIDQIYDWIDPVPLGVGSIAQVHKAKLNKGVVDTIIRQAKLELLPYSKTLIIDNSLPINMSLANSEYSNSEKKMILQNINLVRFLESENNIVAIKILHPRVEKLINRDLRIMSFFANLISLIPTLKWLSLPEEVNTFGEMMRTQLDLRNEVQNILQFSLNSTPLVSFPVPIPQLSTSDFLVERYCDGVSVNLFLKYAPNLFDKQISRIGLDSFMRMMILDNFIHSDLHPGNILVQFKPPDLLPKPLGFFSRLRTKISSFSFNKNPIETHPGNSIPNDKPASNDPSDLTFDNTDVVSDSVEQVSINLKHLGTTGNSVALSNYLKRLFDAGYKPNLVFIDCGLVVNLDDRSRRNFIDLFDAISRFDGKRAGELIADRCPHPEQIINRDDFVEKLASQVDEIKMNSLKLGTVSATSILLRTMDNARRHHVRLDHSFVNLAVAIFVLEGIGRQLDSDLDLLKASVPVLRLLFRQQAQTGLTKLISTSENSPDSADTEPLLGNRTKFDLLKLWAYIELRDYFNRVIPNWGMDESEYFGEFTPYVSYID
ncbi:ABC1 family protein [Smittium mucronatum]|uniref:ABC1 family protein n=1 Tax=Smittium mucronatum TaxID=133383 RepID=A0A1R0GS95_9FUNG|nr:ABC1 family protein [Smittium mucronatum]